MKTTERPCDLLMREKIQRSLDSGTPFTYDAETLLAALSDAEERGRDAVSETLRYRNEDVQTWMDEAERLRAERDACMDLIVRHNNCSEALRLMRRIIRLMDVYIDPDDRPEMQQAMEVDNLYVQFREVVQ